VGEPVVARRASAPDEPNREQGDTTMNARTTNITTSHRHRRHALVAVASLLLALAMLLLGATSADAARRHSPVSWAPDLNRKIVPLRGEAHGPQVATWYGPGFFGQGTACGQTLTASTWGIAHRTLPCGTLVTLSHRGRKVTVRVIDRGPFSGATVDLTSRTKSYLKFTSGTVRMTEVKRFRMLPKPNRRVVGTFAARS
jgi:rare lipoprotein A (peptidoglycan hydrolase)